MRSPHSGESFRLKQVPRKLIDPSVCSTSFNYSSNGGMNTGLTGLHFKAPIVFGAGGVWTRTRVIASSNSFSEVLSQNNLLEQYRSFQFLCDYAVPCFRRPRVLEESFCRGTKQSRELTRSVSAQFFLLLDGYPFDGSRKEMPV